MAGSFAYAYKEIVADKPIEYVRIMLSYLVVVVLSLLAPLGIVGIISILAGYAGVQATIISLSSLIIYLLIAHVLLSGSYGSLIKALDDQNLYRKSTGIPQMINYMMKNAIPLTIMKTIEYLVIGVFAGVVLGASMYLNLLANTFYLGIIAIVVLFFVFVVRYLFSMSVISYMKTGKMMASISKSFKIALAKIVYYFPGYIIFTLVIVSLLIPILNLVSVMVLYPMAMLALIKEYEKLM
jgi:hypothetical protein